MSKNPIDDFVDGLRRHAEAGKDPHFLDKDAPPEAPDEEIAAQLDDALTLFESTSGVDDARICADAANAIARARSRAPRAAVKPEPQPACALAMHLTAENDLVVVPMPSTDAPRVRTAPSAASRVAYASYASTPKTRFFVYRYDHIADYDQLATFFARAQDRDSASINMALLRRASCPRAIIVTKLDPLGRATIHGASVVGDLVDNFEGMGLVAPFVSSRRLDMQARTRAIELIARADFYSEKKSVFYIADGAARTDSLALQASGARRTFPSSPWLQFLLPLSCEPAFYQLRSRTPLGELPGLANLSPLPSTIDACQALWSSDKSRRTPKSFSLFNLLQLSVHRSYCMDTGALAARDMVQNLALFPTLAGDDEQWTPAFGPLLRLSQAAAAQCVNDNIPEEGAIWTSMRLRKLSDAVAAWEARTPTAPISALENAPVFGFGFEEGGAHAQLPREVIAIA
ncbi:hypothetical protein [Vitreimonas flagellata]|uniref:hypothetical protein n=1 Tax=Vitreimonas flagellata TaxID=2560861 RepID=UPI0010757D63|nr:hypothetical protein [Vitreimonas flagellata]